MTEKRKTNDNSIDDVPTKIFRYTYSDINGTLRQQKYQPEISKSLHQHTEFFYIS